MATQAMPRDTQLELPWSLNLHMSHWTSPGSTSDEPPIREQSGLLDFTCSNPDEPHSGNKARRLISQVGEQSKNSCSILPSERPQGSKSERAQGSKSERAQGSKVAKSHSPAKMGLNGYFRRKQLEPTNASAFRQDSINVLKN